MKLKNKILFFISILIFLSACTEEDNSEVFSEDDMTSVLVDIHLLEAKVVALKLTTDTMRRVYNTLELDILKQYNADKAYYENSYRHYLGKPEQLKKIYDRVVDSLNVVNQNAKFREDQYKEEQKRKSEEKREKRKLEKEKQRRLKEGLPEEIDVPEDQLEGFVGPQLYVVRSEMEQFELLIVELKLDSLAAVLRDSIDLEVSLLDSIEVDSLVMKFKGVDSIPLGVVEEKVWKTIPKLKSKLKLDSLKKLQKK